MTVPWLHLPYVNVKYVASRLYGSNSRLHTYRLQKKMKSAQAFEPWEIQKLNQIKQELFYQLGQENP
ncbi:hypothetical protein GXP67_14890 [Rhodocytophaga rosea]|uniref:Uncharacterized protein n=1 Tax=Rhodocytophaga rosea TaxID=2704465 RepID=A0A6C0GJG9_9BACT|nr:hypothetical protein [Rhodocytophaga rosea]QHT67833.1 hypothetical protein GXP67_14890 [Rhodocytophaga rosea]